MSLTICWILTAVIGSVMLDRVLFNRTLALFRLFVDVLYVLFDFDSRKR
jgi:hypothetical protein